jgi:hypothetical protein
METHHMNSHSETLDAFPGFPIAEEQSGAVQMRTLSIWDAQIHWHNARLIQCVSHRNTLREVN